MLMKDLALLPFFRAGDATTLAEVLHPKQDPVTLPYSLAFAWLEPGTSSLPHRLGGSEVYLFTKGSGILVSEGEEQAVQAGTVGLVPPQALQYLRNTGAERLEFYCIVSPPWTADTEEVC